MRRQVERYSSDRERHSFRGMRERRQTNKHKEEDEERGRETG